MSNNLFSAFASIKKTLDKEDKIVKALEELKNLDVLVGIPQEKDSRNKSKITNVELAYIHSQGSPLKNIPARPFIEPAIEDQKDIIGNELGNAVLEALQGNPENAKKHLNMAGMIGMNASRGWFVNPKNGWSPLRPITIKRKGSDKPLIDTGQLRKSITYVIRDKSK